MTEKELKERLFSLYWGQDVLWFPSYNYCRVNAPNMWGKGDGDQKKDAWLELRSIESMTDEECIELFELEGMVNFIQAKKSENGFWIFLEKRNPLFKYDVDLTIKQGDYLRSIGIALPYMGISVDEQINRNWIKLKQ